jgi:peptidoglycan/xylan/chitin deacetylase (PgdA/CDA1 family)
MDAATLDRLLGKLRRSFDVVRVCDLPDRLAGRPRRRPLAAITVDDGYEDFHSVALPVLARHRAPATVYATAGFVDRRCWMWWDALRYLLDAHPGPRVELEIGGAALSWSLTDANARQETWHDISERLVQDNLVRVYVLRTLQEVTGVSLPDVPPPAYAAMSWQQLRECQAAGIEVGGHSMSHAFLPSLSPSDLAHEIADAKALMEAKLNTPVTTFAYPNGMPYDWSESVEQAVRAAGFKAAVLAYPRPFDPGDRYRYGRWSTSPNDRRLDMMLSGLDALRMGRRQRLRA